MLGQREPAKLGPPARRNTSLSLMADPYTPASTASFRQILRTGYSRREANQLVDAARSRTDLEDS